VLAMGNRLVYRETYEQALAELTGSSASGGPAQTAAPSSQSQAESSAATTTTTAPPLANPALTEVRDRLKRYRDLSAQGKWAEAGRELEAIERLVSR